MAEDFSQANAPYGYESGTNTPISKEEYDKTQNQQLINSGHGIYAEQQPFVPASQSNFAAQNAGTPSMVETPSYDLSNVGSADVTMGVNKAIQDQNRKPAVEAPAMAEEAVQQPVQTSGSEISLGTDPRNPAFNMYESAINSQLRGAQEAAKAQEAFYAQKSVIDEQKKQEMDAKQAAFDMDWDKKTKEYDNTLAEMKAAGTEKVIPGAFLARQDTSGALATGIAVALGAFAATAAGTSSNLGIEMINKAIDRDIDAQKFNIENKLKSKKEELSSQNTLLGRMKDKYENDKSALLATRALMLNSVEDKMKLQLAKTSLPLEAQAKAQEQLANVKMKRLESLAQLKANEMQLQAQAQADDGNLTPDQVFARYGKERAGLYVPSLGMAHSLDISKIGTEKILPVKNTLRSIKEIVDFAGSEGYSKMSPTQRSVMTSKLRDLQMQLKGKANYELGVLTGPDMEILTDITGDPNKIFTASDQLAKLRDAYSRTERKFYSDIGTYFPGSAANINRQKAQSALKYSK